MIKTGTFSDYTYSEKYNFIVSILSKVKKQSIFEDLREIFRVIKKPSEQLLLQMFDIIESVLIYSQKKSEDKKKEGFTKIHKKLQTIKQNEMKEGEILEKELDDLLLQLD